MRKPFRKSTRKASPNSFGGNDFEVISDAPNLFCGDAKNSVVAISHRHPIQNVKTLSSLMDTKNEEYFLSLFPLQKDEIIQINW